MFQDLLVAGLLQPRHLLAADLIDGLVHLLHDVEAVEDVDRLAKFFANRR